MKGVLTLLIVLITGKVVCQSSSLTLYHAYSSRTTINSTGKSLKGWEDLNVTVKVYETNKQPDSIFIGNPHTRRLGVIIDSINGNYKFGNINWYSYSGYESEIFERLQVQLGKFFKQESKQIATLIIKYTDFTISFKLAND